MATVEKGHLVFACGQSLYGVPSELAAEVVNLPTLTRVPGAPAHLLGVFAHRGEVVAVVDLSQLAGNKVEDAFRRAVLLRTPKGAVALTATRVAGVSALPPAAERLGDGGLQAHLRGPVSAPQGEVAVIEPVGLMDFLSGT